MTSKSLFIRLMREELKRRIWLISLGFLVLFFAMPVGLALQVGDWAMRAQIENVTMDYLFAMYNDFGTSNELIYFIIIIAAVICASSSFSHLHSKRKTDLYHSIPVNRGTLFAVNYSCSIIILAAVYLINLLLSIIVMGANGISIASFAGNMAGGWIYHTAYFILLYTISVIAVVMTGNNVVGVLGTGVFYFYFVIAVPVIFSYFSTFFRSYNNYQYIFFDKIIWYLSPVSSYMRELLDNNYSEGSIVIKVIAVLLISVLFMLAALLLYKARPSEAAERAMGFKKSEGIIKIFIVPMVSIVSYLCFWQLRESVVWAVFGFVSGLLLSSAIMEMIYRSDFRKGFDNKKHIIICAVISLFIICSFQMDLFGFDSYIPDENDVEYAGINIGREDSWLEYGKIIEEDEDTYWKYTSKTEHVFENMKLQNIQPILEIAKAGIKRNESIKNRDELYNTSDDDTAYTSVYIKYHLKNGKDVTRSYYIPYDEIMDNINELRETPGYMEAVYPILNKTSDEIAEVKLLDRNRNFQTLSGDKDEILSTYQKEFGNRNFEHTENEKVVGVLTFLQKRDKDILSSMTSRRREYAYNDVYGREVYPVYESFNETIGLLKKCGADIITEVNADDITDIVVTNGEYADAYQDEEGRAVTFEEKEQIKAIMDASVPEYYSEFYSMDNMHQFIQVEVHDKSNKYDGFYIMFKDKTPEFLKQAVLYKE